MKKLAGIFAGALLVLTIGACSQQGSEDVVAAVAVPTETAEEFVARANAELKDLNDEIGAADWVRATYITQDTAIIAAAASEKYAKWHGGMVQQALAYDGQARILYSSTQASLHQDRRRRGMGPPHHWQIGVRPWPHHRPTGGRTRQLRASRDQDARRNST